MLKGNFCISLDNLPTLSDESNQKILNVYKENLNNFHAYKNIDGVTTKVSYMQQIGFSGIRLDNTSQSGFNTIKNILEDHGIHLCYDHIYFVLQRIFYMAPPHTDPGRYASLIYNIIGEATTKFYTMENFIPNIDYKDHILEVAETHKMKLCNWYLFNNGSIHSVHDINGYLRVSLTINSNLFTSYDTAKKDLNIIFR